MGAFVYEAKDDAGVADRGVINATSQGEANQMLRREGKTVMDLRAQNESLLVSAPRPRKVRTEDVLYVTNQLAVMVDTGVPLLEALDNIAEQSTHTGVRAMVADIGDMVRGGSDFSAALAKYPKQFDNLFVSTIRASELSGTMGRMLERLAEHMRSQREIRNQVRGAMIYPIVILTFSLGILTAMMVFILPRFEKIYAGKNAVLPTPTRVLLGVSHVVCDYWYLVLAGMAALGVGVWYGLQTDTGKTLADKWRLQIPLMGAMYHKLYLARSLRTLATMLSSGVELLDCIRIASDVVSNRLYRAMWLRVEANLRKGRTLSEEMFDAPLIPRSMAQMIASGDKSGRLSHVMGRIADFCDSDVRIGVKSLTSIIEPVMIIVMGLMVGGIAMALLLPVFNISKVVGT